MCRTNGRRCPRHRSVQRDRERRKAMRTYRADVATAAKAVAGPHVLDVIAAAPTAALAPLAAELGLNPTEVSSVAPSNRLNHDITETLRAFAVAQATDTAEAAAAEAATQLADEVVTVTSSPAPEGLPFRVPSRNMPAPWEILRKTELDTFAAPTLRALLFDPHADAAELDAAEQAAADKRQRYTDMCVTATRALRADTADTDLDNAEAADPDDDYDAPETWESRRAAELAAVEAAEKVGGNRGIPSFEFYTADGEEHRIDLRDARRAGEAYARLTGIGGVDLAYFTVPDNSDAALAFVAHLGGCHTPEQAIGEANWQRYLTQAEGDETAARKAAATDIAALSDETATAYITRAAAEERWTQRVDRINAGATAGLRQVNNRMLAGAAEAVVDRWQADPAAAWAALPDATLGPRRLVFDDLITPRALRGENPFDRYDMSDNISGSGGLYQPEENVVGELSMSLSELLGTRDRLAADIAAEFAAAARAVRDLPTDTLAARTERQWRLVELTEAAGMLANDPEALRDVTLVPVDDPNQMVLFSGDDRSVA